jgi:hypothetical protein
MSSDVRKVIGILSIPRSGTTMLTAAFAAAPDVTAVYEPFNSDKRERWREGTMTLDRLLADYDVDTAGRSLLVVKETCTKLDYVDLTRQVLEDAQPPRHSSLLVILRNPLHCFLSQVQGRREWWDRPDLQISAQLFDSWSGHTIRGLKRIFDLLHDVGGMCVSYSALVRRPDELTTILDRLGVGVTGDEATFYERMDTSAVRGDVSFKTNPRPLSAASEERRSEELAALLEKVKSSRWIDPMQQFVTAIDELSSTVAIPAADPWVGEFHALLKLFGSDAPAPINYPRPAPLLAGFVRTPGVGRQPPD